MIYALADVVSFPWTDDMFYLLSLGENYILNPLGLLIIVMPFE